jgi:hypothetical protein
MKVRYCVNNEWFGVLHLHPEEDEEEAGAPFVLLLDEGEFMEQCKRLKKGDVVVLTLDENRTVVDFFVSDNTR